MGEVALAMFFKNISAAVAAGDLTLNGGEFEMIQLWINLPAPRVAMTLADLAYHAEVLSQIVPMAFGYAENKPRLESGNDFNKKNSSKRRIEVIIRPEAGAL